MNFRAYADSEGPDQPAHPRRLIRAFAVPIYRNIGKCRMFDAVETAHAQNGPNTCISHVLKGTFALDTDPILSATFYTSPRKKSLLCGLKFLGLRLLLMFYYGDDKGIYKN